MRQREGEPVAVEFRDLAINGRYRLLVATAEHKSSAIGVSERETHKRIVYSLNKLSRRRRSRLDQVRRLADMPRKRRPAATRTASEGAGELIEASSSRIARVSGRSSSRPETNPPHSALARSWSVAAVSRARRWCSKATSSLASRCALKPARKYARVVSGCFGPSESAAAKASRSARLYAPSRQATSASTR